MENIAKDGSLSPTKIAHADVAMIEEGRSSGAGKGGKKHSCENIRIPWQVMDLTNDQVTGRKRRSSMPTAMIDSIQEPTIDVAKAEGSPKGATSTKVISNKQVAGRGDNKISMEVSSFNDPATKWNEVKVSNRQKNEVDPSVAQKINIGRGIRFDLNSLPIDEGQNKDSPPSHGIQGLDLNQQMKGEMHSSIVATYETAMEPTGGVKTETEAKCPSLEKNIAFAKDINEMEPSADNGGGDAGVFRFDLNEVPVADEDEDED